MRFNRSSLYCLVDVAASGDGPQLRDSRARLLPAESELLCGSEPESGECRVYPVHQGCGRQLHLRLQGLPPVQDQHANPVTQGHARVTLMLHHQQSHRTITPITPHHNTNYTNYTAREYSRTESWERTGREGVEAAKLQQQLPLWADDQYSLRCILCNMNYLKDENLPMAWYLFEGRNETPDCNSYYISLLKDRRMYSSVTVKPPSEVSASSVNIYLRNYKKMAKLVSVPTPILCAHLAQFIAAKFATAPDRLALFYNGERVDLSPEAVELKEKSIVHVVQLDRTRADPLTVFFKFARQGEEVLKVKASPKMQIRSVFEVVSAFVGKGEKEVFFAYLGRPVNIFRSFEEELVQEESELMVLEFKKAHVRHFQNVNQTQQYSNRDISFASTKMLGMPALGGRSISVLNAKKANKGNLLQPSSIKEELPPELEKLIEIKQESNIKGKKEEWKAENAAPGHNCEENAAPGVYHGFDPHLDCAAPMQKVEVKPQSSKLLSKQVNPCLQSNPELQTFKIKQKDLLYLACPSMEQTQNFTAGVVQEYKSNFLKKQSSSGKENKK